ncbi:tyrosine-type recombinase/integrase [Limosilactobacillus fermentum]|uniref:tyrosine-type recombinase/integrase n=1 Tax=Limosilactobacillus fermentum TaxID=1613 RepID=UPI00240D581C|nr:tyrosine-type recombinase/integrase [Limosilactobacillus fermentum]WFA02824.1 tyrosine-type recombinase/integrase [Limosilactobacillus fermentum]
MSFAKKAKKGYYGIAEYEDKNGVRRQKSAGRFSRKNQALAAAVALEEKLNKINQELKDYSLVDYYWRWYTLYEKDSITTVTQNRYKVIGSALKKYWGDTRLRDIKRSDYQAFMNWYGANHARDSVSKDFTSNVKVVYNRQRERKVQYLTSSEFETLKRATVAGLDHHNTSRYMILTAIYTGMRKAEVQALTWKDIDFKHATITVNKSSVGLNSQP